MNPTSQNKFMKNSGIKLLLIIFFVFQVMCSLGQTVVQKNIVTDLRDSLSKVNSTYAIFSDTIYSVVLDDIEKSGWAEGVYYRWCMASGFTKKELKQMRNKKIHALFLTPSEYREESFALIDSLILDEVIHRDLNIFNYNMYNKQCYFFQSQENHHMAFVCCGVSHKDAECDWSRIYLEYHWFPYGFYAVIDLTGRKIKYLIN